MAGVGAAPGMGGRRGQGRVGRTKRGRAGVRARQHVHFLLTQVLLLVIPRRVEVVGVAVRRRAHLGLDDLPRSSDTVQKACIEQAISFLPKLKKGLAAAQRARAVPAPDFGDADTTTVPPAPTFN